MQRLPAGLRRRGAGAEAGARPIRMARPCFSHSRTRADPTRGEGRHGPGHRALGQRLPGGLCAGAERVLAIAGGVPGEHATLPLQGAGHFVTEAALRTFVPPGGKVLIPMNGAYAQRMARLAREAGRSVVELPLTDRRGATAGDILPALEADAEIGTVAFVYNETGSGIVNDAEGIGAAVRRAGRRMVLDAVSAFGALPFSLAEHPECDALVFTSGKCLEGMPGMGFAVARVDRLEACAGHAGSWSLDLSDVLAHRAAVGLGVDPLHPAGAGHCRLRRGAGPACGGGRAACAAGALPRQCRGAV